MVELGFLILGIATGVLSGLFGIGGGIIMVPSLIMIFGMNILDANAASLTSMLLPVGILGVIAYYKAGMINVKDSLLLAVGLFAGSFLGGEFAVNMSQVFLTKLYAGILLYIAISYLDIPSYFKKKKQLNQSEEINHLEKPFFVYVLIGIAAGIFAGLFGKGGGIIIVPMLIGILHYNHKAAAATSLAALQLPVGLPSVIIYAQNGHLNIIAAAFIAFGIIVGTFFGSKIGMKLPSSIFKKIFAIFLVIVAIYMVYKYV
jgi:uncharacterized membrane protein YfcA